MTKARAGGGGEGRRRFVTTTYLPRRPKTKSNRKLTPTNGRGTAELREDSVACLRLAYRQPTGETRVLRSGTPVSVQMHHFSRGFSLKELQNFTRKKLFSSKLQGQPDEQSTTWPRYTKQYPANQERHSDGMD